MKIPRVLEALQTLNSERGELQAKIDKNTADGKKLTIEWQALCSHPEEYLDEDEEGNIKCFACGHVSVQVKEDGVPVLGDNN